MEIYSVDSHERVGRARIQNPLFLSPFAKFAKGEIE
jgi:hypothetical protein